MLSQTIVGPTYTYTSADSGIITYRSNYGQSMSDTLPDPSTVKNCYFPIGNSESSAQLSLSAVNSNFDGLSSFLLNPLSGFVFGATSNAGNNYARNAPFYPSANFTFSAAAPNNPGPAPGSSGQIIVNAQGKIGARTSKATTVRNNILSRCPIGQLQVAAGFGGYTFNHQIYLNPDILAVRVGMPNLTSGTSTVAGGFGFDVAPGAINSIQSKGSGVANANWQPLVWSGTASITRPATLGSQRPSWSFTDWIPATKYVSRTDGVNGSIMHLRIVDGTALGDGTWFNAQWAASTTTEAVATYRWASYRSNSAVDYATTNQDQFAGNSTNAVAGACGCIVQYLVLEPGLPMFTIGDSIYAQTASAGVMVANGYGWASLMRDTLAANNSIPVELANLGWPGQTADQYAARYQDLAPYLANHLMLYGAWTPNSTHQPITQADSTFMSAYLGQSLALAEENNCIPLLQTPTPVNAPTAGGGAGGSGALNYGASDSIRLAFGANLLAQYPLTFDLSPVLSGNQVLSGSDTGQMQYATGLTNNTSDGKHPDDAGQSVWRNYLTPYIQTTFL